ncbi:FAD-binding oxidoreductase [Paralimibaculum aggregatum]|uniref:FAD-binding oxidoreductase n=1 Tax=Paralimibaculum aggregatum TaxID=3036245 RepID=A0ABQ6LSU3_9RHOB|nr:FAD-binding oxidoreductase [Limibaculum sp. NKW23]GMG85132.1 FAD-binding oxidoreductase [Limibaculum sp. NKW23]
MTGSLWELTAPGGPACPALAGEARAEVCIIGGGLTGLSAALHLAEAGADCLLLEAHAPGWGASGRSGGQIIPGLKFDPSELRERLGEAAGGRLIRFAAGTAGAVFDLARRHAIACEAVRNGWVQPAHSEAGLARLRRRAADWRAHGAPVEDLDAPAVARLLGSGGYLGGLIDRRGGSVQPLAFTRGLVRAAAAAGARIHGASPVRRLAREGAGWVAETPAARVVARSVVVATNAYAGALVPGLACSVVPVTSIQCATEPLPGALAGALMPEGQCFSDTRRLLRYFRKDAAGRIVMGGRGPDVAEISARHTAPLQAALREVFPALDGIRFTHHWGGRVAMTLDHLPHLHMPEPGLIAALGYNGRGMALATALGPEIARLARGGAPEAAAIPVTGIPRVPLHGLHRLGVGALAGWYRLLDARDVARARR